MPEVITFTKIYATNKLHKIAIDNKTDLVLNFIIPWNRASSKKMYSKGKTINQSISQIVLMVIWGVNDFDKIKAITSQNNFDSRSFMNHSILPRSHKQNQKEEIYMLVDFIFMTIISTFQMWLNKLTLKNHIFMFRANLTVLILYNWIFDFSVI
jgi:hypothetical protein